MATEEHKYLADIIKNTHATLREEAQNYGPEIAWKRHTSRKDILQVRVYLSEIEMMEKISILSKYRQNNLIEIFLSEIRLLYAQISDDILDRK